MRFPASFRTIVVSAAFALSVAGCHACKSRNTSDAKPSEPWTKHLRAPDGSLRSTGLDPKARDIERSLGVQ